jgi:hypothetical protein
VGGSVAVREGLPQIFHPISHRTPEYRMGKDSIRLLAAIKKRLNFQTQRDRKIQGKINSNSLGNRCSIRLSYETDCGSRSGCVALP